MFLVPVETPDAVLLLADTAAIRFRAAFAMLCCDVSGLKRVLNTRLVSRLSETMATNKTKCSQHQSKQSPMLCCTIRHK